MSISELKFLRTEIGELRQSVEELRNEVEALKTAGFVTLLDLKRVVPAIINWTSAEGLCSGMPIRDTPSNHFGRPIIPRRKA